LQIVVIELARAVQESGDAAQRGVSLQELV
jgi:hypothetical protein